jgi:nucleotide-binding universal stress UspA family protein
MIPGMTGPLDHGPLDFESADYGSAQFEPLEGPHTAPEPAPARQAGDGPSLVVVGVDGTASAWRAFAWACGHARRSHCPVLAIFASTTGYLDCAMPNAMAAGAMAQAIAEMADDLRSEVSRAGAEFGVPVRFEHRRGDPAKVLLGAADRHNADLVVIGAPMQALHRLTGSIAARLARSRKIPIVVVP